MKNLHRALLCGVVVAGLNGITMAAERCPVKMDCEGHFQGIVPSAATVLEFEQALGAGDEDYFRVHGQKTVLRRYLRYVPRNLPAGEVPLLLVFHGSHIEAETVAWSENFGDFERLADEKHFILVYPNAYSAKPDQGWKYPGVWRACRGEHAREAPDVSYVREIVAQLDKQYPIDQKRIYAAGVSNGGGMVFGLALEAPDLVAAIVAAIPEPYSPADPGACLAKSGYDKVSVMMMPSTDDPLIDFTKWGMMRIRDDWRTTLAAAGEPLVERLPDTVSGDAMNAPTSYLERYRYPLKPDKGEFWFVRMVGAGHSTPQPRQTDPALWSWLGKRNQDAHFSDLVWEFVSRQAKRP
jgi:poly(3-hydroxybutyrate) depolymerase